MIDRLDSLLGGSAVRLLHGESTTVRSTYRLYVLVLPLPSHLARATILPRAKR